MDEVFKNQLQKNGARFQRSLDRIAEKYSKIQQYGDDAIEVDLDNTHIETLQRYMTLSKKNVNKLSKGFADLKEESLSLNDITKESQVNYPCEERTDCFETTTFSENNDTETVPRSHTVNTMDENWRNYTVQPEDEEEQLEMSFQSQGSSLGELYPDMISQIGNAWRRQHVSEAADSVLRRYRKWRKSNRMQLTNSYHTAQKPDIHKGTRQRDIFNKQHYNPKSPVKSLSSTMIKAGSMSPVKMLTSGQKSPHYYSPMKRREAPPTAIVMDMSALSEPCEMEINKTFTVYEPTSSYSSYTSSPSRSFYPPNRPSQDLIFRMKESCMSPRCMQSTNCSGFAAENSLLKERHEIYSSPVRQSPYKSNSACRNSFSEQIDIYGSPVRKSPFRLHTSRESLRQSPYAAISKSPYMKQSISKERSGFNSASNFVPSVSPKIMVPRRTLEYSDLQLSPQLGSPQMGNSRRHHRLRRHLSFDSSSLTSSRASYTTKDFDNDFIKLYHKLVCLNKSSHIQGHPCRFCAKNSEASRGHSFSNLAALALSPHRPLLRKRHRDLDIYPQSKRFKDGHFTKYL
ncbi:uncharacterized protein si:dkeyp-117h8.4 [Boleophthalmus pectinirostris]|uniref:uncharacterized protein si:dkeyp-117h8.4 n=1 Tax=Boleophthalmus pectinirostris TaxID=150288 RepID=UPI000A1C4175|nr:uncharacterized protein si:dkeyp-117h8.4 [Boleophthalmus pectinirostris]